MMTMMIVGEGDGSIDCFLLPYLPAQSMTTTLLGHVGRDSRIERTEGEVGCGASIPVCLSVCQSASEYVVDECVLRKESTLFFQGKTLVGAGS